MRSIIHIVGLAIALALPVAALADCRTGTAAASISSEQYVAYVPSMAAGAGSAVSLYPFYVRDATGNALKSAQVEFILPDTAPTATFGSGGTYLDGVYSGFTPSATPHRAVASTGSDSCMGSIPLIVLSDQPGTFTMTARLVSDPSISMAIPVTILATSTIQPTLSAGLGGGIVQSGTPLPVGVDASVSSTYLGPVAGVPVTFTAPTSGPSVRFQNGATSITVQSDAFGVAHADATANSTAGAFTVQASIAGQHVSSGTFVVAGPAAIQLSTPAVSARERAAQFLATLDLPWWPCNVFGGIDDIVSFTIDGASIPGPPSFQMPYRPFSSYRCTGAGGTTATTGASAEGLLPGQHVFEVSFPSSPSATLAFSLAPHFEGPSATGAGTLRLSVSDPNYGGESGSCDQVTAAPSKLGDTGLPAVGPPGFDLPYGVVRVSGAACSWPIASGTMPSPPMQRVVLGTDGVLPPSTTAWEYGATSDNVQPHWHALSTALSGSFAVFEVAGIRSLPDSTAFTLDTVVALGEPKSGMVRNYQDLWWAGPAENGWGMSLTQHGDVLFGALFVYDAAGDPTWIVMPGGHWNADHTVYTGDVYRPHGSPYSAYNAAAFAAGSPVGRADLTFDSDATFTLDYTIDGISGRKRLQREAFGAVEPFAIAPVADLWWGGESQNGWGFALAQQYRTLFGVLFTYDADGKPVWFAAPAGSMAGSSYMAALYRTHGSPWLGAAYDPARLTVSKIGVVSITFQDGWASGQFGFTIDGTAVGQNVVRQPF